MTPIRDARVLKRGTIAEAGVRVLHGAGAAPISRRRLPREVVDAHLVAARLVEDAKKEAAEILARAREEAEGVAERAAEEARQVEHAKLAALYLALRLEDDRRCERDLDRAVELARVLAERLLGEALEADPSRVVALARQALAEARGTTRAVIESSPLDADALRRHLLEVAAAHGLAPGALDVKIDARLSRGSLRVHTNLGTLDVQLAPQLERLAKALRDALA